ncbi:hypothetical protein [Modestobacter italicus]|uniref:hypothetical protein n=1 Tax=Modestobacter italicus (strain DSM 44449 / CECT 9708 / BC 501) TaxID=2732864 RepID=UPI001C96A21A|nr:hypothetical protein [Modestobacter italicus]
MRLPPVLASGVSAAAALVLLTACGGDDSAESSASTSSSSGAGSSSATSSAPETAVEGGSSDEEVQAFCSQAETVFTELDTAFEGASDPAQLPALLQQATDAFESVDPPAEIEGSWTAFSDSLGGLADSAASTDLTTPEGLAQFQQEYEQLTADATAAQGDVEQYVTANCPGAGASPTS